MAKNIEPSLKLISGYFKMEKLLLFVVFFLSTNFVIAQNTILWSVKQRNSDKVSYILATFHQMGNSFIDEKPLIKELMSNSKLVFF